MSSTGMATPVESSGPSKSFLERFIGVFISPGETFADIARKPDFIAPLVLVLLALLAINETVLFKIGPAQITRQALEQNSLTAKMPQEQKDLAIEASSHGWRLAVSHISPAIAIGMMLAIFAAIGLGIANAVFGGQVNFKAAFAISCYAHLVTIVGTVMAIPLIFFGDPENFKLATPVPSNPAFFMNPQEVSSVVYALAGRVDVLTIWSYILLGLGFAAALGPKAKAASMVMSFMGVWFIITLLRVGLAAVVG